MPPEPNGGRACTWPNAIIGRNMSGRMMMKEGHTCRLQTLHATAEEQMPMNPHCEVCHVHHLLEDLVSYV